MTSARFTLVAVISPCSSVLVAGGLPNGVTYMLAVIAVVGFILAFFPAFVGFVGLLTGKPREQIEHDKSLAGAAAVPIALLCGLVLIIYLVGTR